MLRGGTRTGAPNKHLIFTDYLEQSPARTSYRILLVDDDERTRQLLRDILENFPDMRIVAEAKDGKEAVDLAILRQPDVVLMDVNLPTLDGIQATYSIKETCRRTLVIGLSEHFTPSIYTDMRTAGAAAFICKGELLAVHERILCALRHSTNKLTEGIGGGDFS